MAEGNKSKSPYGSRKFTDIDDYHAVWEPEIRARLEILRQTIHEAVPGLRETISYNMPAFRLRTNLVYYAVHQQHIGFYPTAAPIQAFSDRLAAFKFSKGAVQFPHDQALPFDLVKDMVQFRAIGDKKLK
jgi:uncharacterized protein YdhG (YjbR/CyaY superfamily)